MIQYLQGDCRQILATLPEQSVNCCVTSPPYWGLRDYGVDGQLGLEPTFSEYIAKMVEVFREVRRVLRDDGTLWLNIGDSYITNPGNGRGGESVHGGVPHRSGIDKIGNGLKPKNLAGIPWRLAFALQDDGWILRSDIIWNKPNCMPESVTDRPTKAHEYIFLLTKNETYFYDADAIKEPAIYSGLKNQDRSGFKDPRKFSGKHSDKQRGHSRRHVGFNDRWDAMTKEEQCSGMRNKRDVWTVATSGYRKAHFATFPPELIRPCIRAGCPDEGTVLDPFGGSGTTGLVAEQESRNAILIELNPEYVQLQRERTCQTSLLAA